MRKRRRVARVAPRRHRRLVAVADGGDDDNAVRDRVGDGVRLEPREAVAVRVERVADAAEAHVDDPRAVRDGPAARASASIEIVRDFVTTFATSSSADGASPAMPIPLPTPAAMSRDEGPVPERVRPRRPADEALRGEILPARLSVKASTPESMTATGTRLERGQRDPRLVEAALGQVPLLRHERVVGSEREMPLGEGLDVPDSGIPTRAARDGASTTSAGIGARRSGARPHGARPQRRPRRARGRIRARPRNASPVRERRARGPPAAAARASARLLVTTRTDVTPSAQRPNLRDASAVASRTTAKRCSERAAPVDGRRADGLPADPSRRSTVTPAPCSRGRTVPSAPSAR